MVASFSTYASRRIRKIISYANAGVILAKKANLPITFNSPVKNLSSVNVGESAFTIKLKHTVRLARLARNAYPFELESIQ